MITIETKNLVIRRIGDDEFIITFDGLEMDTDEYKCRIGDRITVPVYGMLVQHDNDKTLMVKVCETQGGKWG